MKKGYTDIILVLDKSGSMRAVLQDTIGGFNQFIEDQTKVEGEAKFSLVEFDTTYSIVHNGLDINDVPEMTTNTYRPSGMTALYDAVGRAITEAGSRFKSMKDDERPEKVIFVILTDGYENSSVEISGNDISKMIKHQDKKYNWEFVYLGANQNAFDVADNLNIARHHTMSYAHTPGGTEAAFKSLSKGMTKSRGISGQSANVDYFDKEDYADQESHGVKQDNNT